MTGVGTGQRPIDRWHTRPPTHPDPAKIIDAFQWSAVRKVTKTATISLEGNTYVVDPMLVGRRVEVRFDPEDLTRLDVHLDGRPAGIAVRTEVLDVRSLVTVAEITTSARGLAAEVGVDHASVGLDQESVVNCDGLHTVAQSTLTTRVGEVDDDTMHQVCSAISYALGC